MTQVTRSEEIETSLRSGTYDFIDFGCSNGASMEFAGKTPGARRGLGIDIDAKKVESTRALGFDAVEYDLTQLTASPTSSLSASCRISSSTFTATRWRGGASIARSPHPAT